MQRLQRRLAGVVFISAILLGATTVFAQQAGGFLQARWEIEKAYANDPDNPEIAKRYAEMKDAFGDHAGDAYFHYASLLRSANSPASDVQKVLTRCVVLSARDGDSEAETRCNEELKTTGSTLSLRHTQPQIEKEGETVVPGGVTALAIAAKVNSGVPSSLFALEFSRALVRNSEGATSKDYLHAVRTYFQVLEDLRKRGKETPAGLQFHLDTGSFDSYYKSQEILKIIGWRLTAEVGGTPDKPKLQKVTLQLGSLPEDSEREVFTSSFGIDFFAVKKALEAFQPYDFKIVSETIPIALDESFWFSRVMKAKTANGGLLSGLADHLAAARMYVALAGLTPDVRRELLRAVNPDRIALHYADLLILYGPSVNIQNGAVDVPGGPAAAGAWENLSASTVAKPSTFLSDLLVRDNGKLLAYFHVLSQLPPDHQKFFTATPERLRTFYEAFPFADRELIEQHRLIRKGTQFYDLARELPLNEQGEVRFPGSESVWGGSAGASDATLAALLGRKTTVNGVDRYDSDAFVAAVRLERAWGTPMSVDVAQILRANFAKYHALYPYFFSLPPLDATVLKAFFSAANSTESQTTISRNSLNTLFGEFHGVVSLLSILSDTGGLSSTDAVKILSTYCQNTTSAPGLSGNTAAAFDALQNIVNSIAESESPAADDRLIDGFAGPGKDVSFNADHADWTVNRAAWQVQRIHDVFKAQSITPVRTLLDIFHVTRRIQRANPANVSEMLPALETTAGGLREVAARPEDDLTPAEHDYLIQAKPFEIHNLVEDFRNLKGTPDEEPPGNLADLTLQALAPYLKTTLVAFSYAYFAAPQDLAIFEDRYFVRRHRFIPDAGAAVWKDTEAQVCGANAGLCVTGGLAGLGAAAGTWGRSKVDAADNLHTDAFNQAELASIRTVPWSKVSADSVHLAALQMRAGRELVVLAAFDASLRATLDQSLRGTVGSARRLEIGAALQNGNAAFALNLLSSSDLYWLADSLRTEIVRRKLASPLLDSFTSADPATIRTAAIYFGGSHWQTYGAARPELVHPGPYEEYERLPRSEPLWECAGHIMLDIASAADREGIPVDALAILSEPALRQAAAGLQASTDDWLAVVRAMNKIDLLNLLPELKKTHP